MKATACRILMGGAIACALLVSASLQAEETGPALILPEPEPDPDPEPEEKQTEDDPPSDSEPCPCETPTEEDEDPEEDDDSHFTFSWENGLVGRTGDGQFQFHVGGRVQLDTAWYSAPEELRSVVNGPDDGSALRRAVIRLDGTFWEQTEFMFEVDFSGGDNFRRFDDDPVPRAFLRDGWIALTEIPWVGTIRAGHQKEYLTFANATSSRFLTFIERPYIFDAFENDIQWGNGLALTRTYFDERASSWLGFFQTGTRTGGFGVGDGDYAFTGRVTFMPWDEPEKKQWVNLSLSGSVRAVDDNVERVGVRPLIRSGTSFQVPALLDTGTFFANDTIQLGGAGLHGAFGRWTFGGEYLVQNVSNAFLGGLPLPSGVIPPGVTPAGDVFFDGYYLEFLYFLTPNDHRDLERDNPGFARIIPARNFRLGKGENGAPERGWGAWEVGARFNQVNLNDRVIRAGQLRSVTLGLNWLMTPNSRVMFNYIHTWGDFQGSTRSQLDEFGMRMQFDY